jgi:hypothetical protein
VVFRILSERKRALRARAGTGRYRGLDSIGYFCLRVLGWTPLIEGSATTDDIPGV